MIPKIENYDQAVAFLNHRVRFGLKAGLGNIKQLLQLLHLPQNQFDCIVVAGTNGKGSTSLYTASILQAHGVRTGLFTSPHLVSFRERIRVNGQVISEEEVVEGMQCIQEAIGNVTLVLQERGFEPTFFEILTALALWYFAQKNVQVAVLEAGMGGRLDSTNAVDCKLAILTGVGLEHTEVLGDTKEKIILEKLPIARPGRPLFLGQVSTNLQNIAQEYCNRNHISLHFVGDTLAESVAYNLLNKGLHYQHNAHLAMLACREFLNNFVQSVALQALQQSDWPGRMQILHSRNPIWILDGAHNPQACEKLAQAVQHVLQGSAWNRVAIVIAISQDKDLHTMLQFLHPIAHSFHLVPVQSVRLCSPQKMQEQLLHFRGEVKLHPHWQGLEAYVQQLNVPVLVTGSLYFLGEAITYLRQTTQELNWFCQFSPEQNEFG